MKTKIKLLVIVILTIQQNFAQTFVNLTAIKDAPIGFHDCLNTENQNYGGTNYNGAFWMPGQGCAGQPGYGINGNRSLIEFNLSSLPANAYIVSAKLLLYHHFQLPHSGPSNKCKIERITQPWIEMGPSGVTWVNQPLTDSLNNVATIPSSSSGTQDFTVNVTAMVQDMIDNPTSSYGFMLKLQNESVTNFMYFNSRHYYNTDSTVVPRLIIEYLCYDKVTQIADYDAPIGWQTCTNSKNMNYGWSDYNGAFWICGLGCPNQPCFGENANRSLMHFGLGVIPSGANIIDARLSLFAHAIPNVPGHVGTNNSFEIRRVVQNWSDITVTWVNQPLTDSLNNVVYLAAPTMNNQDYTNINVTGIVQDMVSNNNDYGFLLKLQNEQITNSVIFGSKDNPAVNLRPVLEVKWVYDCNSSPGTKHIEIAAISDSYYAKNARLKLSPNPVQSNFELSLENSNHTLSKVTIRDYLGRVVFSQFDLKSKELIVNTDEFSTGIYSITVQDESGFILVEKLIIER